MSFVEQQRCVDESKYAVLASIERKQLNLGFMALPSRSVIAPKLAAVCMTEPSTIKRPAAQY